jgi:Do/DeqQ family serine protease
VQAVERVGPAVVNISTEQVVEAQGRPFAGSRDPFSDDFFRDFFEPRRQRMTRTSLGSGVIVRPDGFVVTNQHVILRGGRVRVTLADEREFEAHLVGTDSDSDLAVLRMDTEEKLPVAPMGDSDAILIGETVIAIGNPFGLSHTVTTGVVSALDRSLKTEDQTYYDFIQTDASINPGNSGGPLLNIDGELVGINTAIYQKAQGIGFAIPANRAKRIVDDLIRYGEVHAPWVGAVVQDLSDELAEHFGVARHRGVLVRGVEEDSPAHEAGVKEGDIVVEIDERAVHSSDQYEQRIRDHVAEAEIRLTLRRDGSEKVIHVRSRSFPLERADAVAWRLIGIRVKEAGGGLAVTEVRRGSSAAQIGIEKGDVLAGVSGAGVETTEQFRKRVVEVRNSQAVLLSIRRGQRIYHVQVALRP